VQVGDKIYAGITAKTLTDIEAGAGLFLICDSTLGASQASFDTNTILGGNIPSTYKDLILRLTLRADEVAVDDQSIMRFNNDSGSNYDYGVFRSFNNAGSGFESRAVSFARIGLHPAASSSSSSQFSSCEVLIPDYNNAAFKTFLSNYIAVWGTGNSTLEAASAFGLWRSTAAITRIQVLPISGGGNWVSGCRFTLWGRA
jgi:hypothetical protein